ncbi:hypothetical protein [Nodosilinea sp. LEGE 07088]|nr:hypothetical protein [Nodosilinea sp. LEGE 07088]
MADVLSALVKAIDVEDSIDGQFEPRSPSVHRKFIASVTVH